MPGERFGEVLLDTTGLAWRNASGRTRIDQVLSKALGVEDAISNGPAASEHRNQRADGAKIMPITSDEVQSDGPSKAVDDLSHFCVRSTFGFSDRLRSGS